MMEWERIGHGHGTNTLSLMYIMFHFYLSNDCLSWCKVNVTGLSERSTVNKCVLIYHDILSNLQVKS
jgi:hypothetical protein